MRLFATLYLDEVNEISLNPDLLSDDVYYIDISPDKVYNIVTPVVDPDSNWKMWKGVEIREFCYDPLNDKYYSEYDCPDDIYAKSATKYITYKDGKIIDERYEIYE